MVIRTPQIHLTSVEFNGYDNVPLRVLRLFSVVEGNIFAVINKNVIFDTMEVKSTAIKSREQNTILLIRRQTFQHSSVELDTLSSEDILKTSHGFLPGLK